MLKPGGGLPGGGMSDSAAASGNDAGSWRDSISLSAGQAGRTPGYILFALIIVVVGVLLCGRERRANLMRRALRPLGLSPRSSDPYRSTPTPFERTRRKLPFGLFGGGETKYDRLMEEGGAPLHNPSDFELGGMSSQSSSANHSSDDDTGSISSKSSGRRKNDGRVTPRRVLYNEGKEDLGLSLTQTANGRGSSSSRQSSPHRKRRDGSGLKESLD